MNVVYRCVAVRTPSISLSASFSNCFNAFRIGNVKKSTTPLTNRVAAIFGNYGKERENDKDIRESGTDLVDVSRLEI